MKSFVVVAFVFVLVPCCISSTTDKEHDASGLPKSLPKQETKITFLSNWDEVLQGSLIPGEAVHIIYNAARLPGRDRRYGQKAWYIFAEVQYTDNGTVHSIRLEGPDKDDNMRTTIKIPLKAVTFIIWFKHWGYYNGYSYDSNYEKNYEFTFNQIVFTDKWHEYVNGDLSRGGKFQVVYNAVRLPWRDLGYLSMGRAWNIFAHVQFSDNGAVVQQMLDGPGKNDPTMTTVYDIPKDAKKVIIWFYFTGYRTGTKYDSNHNKNYHFALTKN